MKKSIALAVGTLFAFTLLSGCQKRPSTAASATCDLGGDLCPSDLCPNSEFGLCNGLFRTVRYAVPSSNSGGPLTDGALSSDPRTRLSAISPMFHRLELSVVWPGNGQQKGGILESLHLMFNRSAQRQHIARAQIMRVSLRCEAYQSV